MRIIRVALTVLLAITAGLYLVNGFLEGSSGKGEGPEILCPEEILEVSVYDAEEALLAGVTAADRQDGDLTGQIIIGGVSKLVSGDTAKVTLLVFDSDDNMASCVRQIRYQDYRRPRIQITRPLVYADRKEAELLERVTVEDVIDGDLTAKARVSALWTTEDERVFSATVMVTNSMGDTASVKVPVIIADAQSKIRLRQQVVYTQVGSQFDPMDHVIYAGSGLEVRSEVDTAEPGCYWVWYEKKNTDGEIAILTVVVE